MIIIWGTKNTEKTMAEIGPYNCTSCNNNSNFQIIRDGYWFSLFYVPVIPLKFDYYRVCKSCGHREELDKNVAKELIAKSKGA